MSTPLLIDCGNTRVKAALLVNHELTVLPALRSDDPEGFDDWAELIRRHDPGRAVISNVAGGEMAAKLTQTCSERWQVTAEFVEPTRTFAGMTTRYEHPGKLGVDRWLAALGAWHVHHRAVAVVDVGTALTLDVVDVAGVHHGGLIAPGLELMARALTHNTAQLQADECAPVNGLALNTQEAIALGCREAVLGLLARARELVAMVAPGCDWYLTGGGGEALVIGAENQKQPGLGGLNFEFEPYLVLAGLKVWVEHNS